MDHLAFGFISKTALLLILFLISPVLSAGTISNTNTDNITTEPGPYTIGVTYLSTIFTDDTKSFTDGAINWVESDVMAPGIGVVNVDDSNPSEELNCIMTSGINPVDDTVKQCSDPFQTSKRFKLNANSSDSSVDLVFDVNTIDSSAHVYRVFEKFLNSTDISIANFQVELGFGTAENFIPADVDIGLDFAVDGEIIVGDIVTGDVNSLFLDALFPAGLFGVADALHPIEGYFDPTARAEFLLTANRGKIESTGITPNYFNLVGDFLSKSQVMQGYFYDHDDDPLTDPITIAHMTYLGWVTFRTDQFWIDQGLVKPPLNLDGTIQVATILLWEIDSRYTTGPIEDLANLNLNYHIRVADAALWPTYNSVDSSATFTLRISSSHYSTDVLFRDGFESSL